MTKFEITLKKILKKENIKLYNSFNNGNLKNKTFEKIIGGNRVYQYQNFVEENKIEIEEHLKERNFKNGMNEILFSVIEKALINIMDELENNFEN